MHLKHKSVCGGCEHAVITTYLELLELGTSEHYAFQTCAELYRIYYPATSKNDAQSAVAKWIDQLTRSWRRKEDAWPAQNERAIRPQYPVSLKPNSKFPACASAFLRRLMLH
jgi:hypothetical protein